MNHILLIILILLYQYLTFSWINSNHKKLRGFPRNILLRQSNSHKRLYKKIEENSLNKNKKELSQDIYKSNLNIFMMTKNDNIYSLNKDNNNIKKILDYKGINLINSKIISQNNCINCKKKYEQIKNQNYIKKNEVNNNNSSSLNKKMKIIYLNNKKIKKPFLKKEINKSIDFNIKKNILNKKNKNTNNNKNIINPYPTRNKIKIKNYSKINNIQNNTYNLENNKILYLLFKRKKLRTNYISPLKSINSAKNTRKNIPLDKNLISQNELKTNL